MKVTFYSNFLNHHQLPFCNEMVKLLGNNFKFVATEKIPDERIQLGYEDMNDKYEFVIKAYENDGEAINLAENSDVIILGSASSKYIKMRLKKNQLCLRYSERIFKNNNSIKQVIYTLVENTLLEKNVYMLCASAFSSRDYNILGAHINKCYKWGYFPELIKYDDIDAIINRKEINSLLWVGRFIDWKHPEMVINLAIKLRNEKINFKIKMIGTGPLKTKIESMIVENKLEKYVILCDSMSPIKVREYMEKSQIYLFTSDKGEGWGAVLNEAMNSGCAIVANSQIGSVPFLIKNNKNGLIYKNNNEYDFLNKVIYLLKNNEQIKILGRNAYRTILDEWNPQVAAKRIVEMASLLLNKNDISELFQTGPCSKARFLKENWFEE